MTIIYLEELPQDHALRNMPLASINAEYRWKKASPATIWRKAADQSKIIQNTTYNQLGETWTKWDDWIVKSENLWDESRIDHIAQNGNNGEHYAT